MWGGHQQRWRKPWPDYPSLITVNRLISRLIPPRQQLIPNLTMRLNKYIAQAGVASRRKADELIASGKVKLNGILVTELGTQVEPDDMV